MHHSPCLPPVSRRLLSVAGLGVILVSFAGCSRFKQQVKMSMDNNPQMRQKAIDASRKSCVDTATAKAPKLPGMDVRIHNYCDCFATKGMNKFSNSELASIGLHGGHFSADQQAKLMEGVQLCQSELLGKSE